MPVSKQEQNSRAMVIAIHKSVKPLMATDKQQIYDQALSQFEKALKAKIANLQQGETLLLTFRLDIADKDGNIRGGSGAERNMPEYIEWRRRVFERDQYVCQGCGKGGDLQAHHIKGWVNHPELRFDVSNGKSLCSDCHAKEHPHLRVINARKKGATFKAGR